MKLLGIGTEIVECLRIAQMIERHDEDFLRRVYTAQEIQYCSSRKLATQHYAALWAGKQAVMKALGAASESISTWRNVELRQQHDGTVTAALGSELRKLCVAKEVRQLMITLAHCRSHATGYAIAMQDDAD